MVKNESTRDSTHRWERRGRDREIGAHRGGELRGMVGRRVVRVKGRVVVR